MDEQEGAGVDLDPQTRESFNLLRQTYDNTAHFVSALLQDRKLQKQLRMIVRTLGPLHRIRERPQVPQRGANLRSLLAW